MQIPRKFISTFLLSMWPCFCWAQAASSQSIHPRQDEAESFAVKWLELCDVGEHKETYALLTDVFKVNLTPNAWRKQIEDTYRPLGKLVSRKLRRIVWYENPKDAPLPGTYAAVEFDSVYDNTRSHFQFVILHSRKGEPFRVMRSESDIALKNAEDKKQPVSKPASLKCDIGPVNKIYGKTQWLVYSCDDDRTIVIVSAPENPATPFVFTFYTGEKGYQLRGQGTGRKEATSAAFNELKALSEQDITALIGQTKRHKKQ